MIRNITSSILGSMYSSVWLKTIYGLAALGSFMVSYFTDLAATNAELYMSVVVVIIVDGFFGLIAGVKREGFKTAKAVKILKTMFSWLFILTTVLSIELGVGGIDWLSDTLIFPFVIIQLISAVKNAAVAGYIKTGWIRKILDGIDDHKNEILK